MVARKSQRWFAWDWGVLVVPLALWVLLLIVGIGAQSLANIIEMVIVIAAIIVTLYVRVFVADKLWPDFRRNSLVAFSACCVLVVLLRFLMPNLPE
jgi:hypothetical protein